jgi:uncharacterized membrane protein YphA (DoxX/SURF4 family)
VSGIGGQPVGDVDANDLALLMIRIVLGIVFVAHGHNHIFGGGKIAGHHAGLRVWG